jgi:enolase
LQGQQKVLLLASFSGFSGQLKSPENPDLRGASPLEPSLETIAKLSALEILDSRGRPTVRATCRWANGIEASASVPAGASRGTAEALELRDGEPHRYRGLGCRRAVANVNGCLQEALAGRKFASQTELDRVLIDLDGTSNKSRLGANAILAVSLAFARATAQGQGVPLFRHFAALCGQPIRTLPRPTINLFSGGQHAGGQSPIQDVLLVPAAARSIDEALAMTFAVYQCAAERMRERYGMRLLRADEGGLAPPFPSPEAMLDDAVSAIQAAGFKSGDDVALAIDVAASHFFRNGRYELGADLLGSAGMIERVVQWSKQYPIVSCEDALAENDWEHWPQLREQLAGRVRVVGDDLLCTHPQRIGRAVTERAADTLLLKVNQIGTVTEALEANHLARDAGWQVTASARSGETEDDWLADLAVGWAADQIKIGSITQSERLSKYNRLLAIEAEMHWPLVPWPKGE